jgi:hypothetical protein
VTITNSLWQHLQLLFAGNALRLTGAAHVFMADVIFTNNFLQPNTVGRATGALMIATMSTDVYGNNSITLYGMTIHNNEMQTGQLWASGAGVGLYVVNVTTISISDSSFIGNSIQRSGSTRCWRI